LRPFQTGLYTLPLALAMSACSPVSGRLIGRFGTRLPLLIAGATIALSGFLLTRLDAATPFALLIFAYVSFGIGFGFVNAPITNTAVSGMPRAQAGLAAAVASTSRQVGASLGVALSGTLASVRARVGGEEFARATHSFFWLVVAAGFLVICLALLSNGGWARASVRKIAALLDEVPAAPPSIQEGV